MTSTNDRKFLRWVIRLHLQQESCVQTDCSSAASSLVWHIQSQQSSNTMQHHPVKCWSIKLCKKTFLMDCFIAWTPYFCSILTNDRIVAAVMTFQSCTILSECSSDLILANVEVILTLHDTDRTQWLSKEHLNKCDCRESQPSTMQRHDWLIYPTSALGRHIWCYRLLNIDVSRNGSRLLDWRNWVTQ